MDIKLPAQGSLIGIGADVIEVDRIRGVLERQGDRFLERVFTAEERAYCFGMKHPHKHLAARFAAKEAVSKCVSVYHGERHQPLVRLDEKGELLLKQVGGTHILLSLSHTDTVAMAVAALVRQ